MKNLLLIFTTLILISCNAQNDQADQQNSGTNEIDIQAELTATFLAVLKKDKSDGIWKLHREVANTRDLE